MSNEFYERAYTYGVHTLTDTELLSLFLPAEYAGSENELLLAIRERGLLYAADLSLEELTGHAGIGVRSAFKIQAVFELTKRITMAQYPKGPALNNPVSVWEYYSERLRHEDRELIYASYFNVRGNFLGEKLLAVGAMDQAAFSMPLVFRSGFSFNASSIILIHNHPSGVAVPSREDRMLTERLLQASYFMSMPLRDHIIIGDKNYFSFREAGLMVQSKGAQA